MKDRASWLGVGGGAWGRFAAAALVVALGTFWLTAPTQAEDATPAPARAVRLSNVDGQVQLVKDGQVVSDQVVANAPLFAGTRVVTAEDGRAEIQFEDGSVARLSPNSALTLSVLHGPIGQGGEADVTLENGLGYFELQGNGQAGVIRVKFGDSVVTASGFTVFRINTDNLPGEVAVFSGNAQVQRGGSVTIDMHGGESVALSGTDPSNYTLTETIEPDSWDSWNSDRDQALNAEGADKTAATKGMPDGNNPAWTDLDANGNWYNVPGSGYVWSPYDAGNAGWDPYGYGNWMFTPGVGWGYISGYSWGYLPYQCGMWNYYNSFGWGWAPGIGGCSPWWNGGLGGYGLNLGILPVGYRPPVIPRMPHRIGPGRGTGPIPLIAVNRKPTPGSTALPPRDRATPVTIAGAKVEPMRPLSPRPTYERSASSYVNRTVPAAGFAAGQAGHAPTGPTFSAGHPGATYSGGGHPSSPSSIHASSGGGGGGSASHASSGGGGGGGGGHSGGGGGGGGGGSHK